jgi:hypothetical protein
VIFGDLDGGVPADAARARRPGSHEPFSIQVSASSISKFLQIDAFVAKTPCEARIAETTGPPDLIMTARAGTPGYRAWMMMVTKRVLETTGSGARVRPEPVA